MIIGPDFLWLHFPKCGGVAAESALKTLLAGRPGIQFDEIDNISGVWHDTTEQRQARDPSFSPDGKRIVCGTRRLPSWVLSLAHFEIDRGEKPPTREMLLRGQVFGGGGRPVKADAMLALFTQRPVHSWIRTEHMADDLARAFDLEGVAIKRENEGIKYVRHMPFWFSAEEMAGLYDANPLWRDLERRVYGDTLAERLYDGSSMSAA